MQIASSSNLMNGGGFDSVTRYAHTKAAVLAIKVFGTRNAKCSESELLRLAVLKLFFFFSELAEQKL